MQMLGSIFILMVYTGWLSYNLAKCLLITNDFQQRQIVLDSIVVRATCVAISFLLLFISYNWH